MDTNRVTGTARTLAGKAEDAFGRVTGQDDFRAQGALDQVAGAAQDAYGRASDAAENSLRRVSQELQERPLATLLIAAAVGYALTWLMRRQA